VKSNSNYADDALYGTGASYFHLRDYSNAIKSFSRLLKSYPQTLLRKYALYQLAISYFNNQMYQDASDTFKTFLTENPQSSEEGIRSDEALFWMARSLYELKDYRGAIQACQQLLTQFPNSETSYKAEFFLAESMYWTGDYQTARAKYQQLLSQYPVGEKAEECQYGVGWTYFSEASEALNKQIQNELYRNAISAWQKTILNYPDSSLRDKAQYHVGIGYLNLKDYDKALESFNLIPSNSDWHDNALYRIAWTYYKKEDYNKAIDAFNDLRQQHPTTLLLPNAIFGLGNCYFKLGKYAEAIKKYQEVVQSSPNAKMPIEEPGEERIVDLRAESQYRIAESYYNLQMYQEAIESYQQLINLHPKSEWADDAQYGIALAYQQMGDSKRALEAHQEILRRYPTSDLAPDVQLNLGNFYYESENYSRAIAEYQKVIDQYSNLNTEAAFAAVWRAQYYIGLSYYKLKSYQQAITAFNRVDKKSEFAGRAAYYVGWCLFHKENPRRDVKASISAFEQLIQQFPDSPEARRALLAIGDAYSELVQWQQVKNTYMRLIKKYPASQEAKQAQLLLAHAFHKLKQNREAVAAYKKITDDKTDSYSVTTTIEALFYLGESLFELAEYEEAAKAYLKIGLVYSEFEPVYALNAFVRAGICYEKLQKWYDAQTWYKRALQEYSSHPKKTPQWNQILEYAKTHLNVVQQEIQKQTSAPIDRADSPR
jgi:TolA-binding protein